MHWEMSPRSKTMSELEGALEIVSRLIQGIDVLRSQEKRLRSPCQRDWEPHPVVLSTQESEEKMFIELVPELLQGEDAGRLPGRDNK